MSNWISVDDEMPECEEIVNTWNGCEIEVDYCDIEVDFGGVYFANDEGGNVTHWMPLPEPPK